MTAQNAGEVVPVSQNKIIFARSPIHDNFQEGFKGSPQHLDIMREFSISASIACWARIHVVSENGEAATPRRNAPRSIHIDRVVQRVGLRRPTTSIGIHSTCCPGADRHGHILSSIMYACYYRHIDCIDMAHRDD